jgi:hypothetical protein
MKQPLIELCNGFSFPLFVEKCGKTSLGSFPVTHLMHYYAETDRSHPINHLTFRITLLSTFSFLRKLKKKESERKVPITKLTRLLCLHDP